MGNDLGTSNLSSRERGALTLISLSFPAFMRSSLPWGRALSERISELGVGEMKTEDGVDRIIELERNEGKGQLQKCLIAAGDHSKHQDSCADLHAL